MFLQETFLFAFLLLPSCKARQEIALRCRPPFVYIYVSVPANQDTSIVQLFPVLCWRVRQLQAPLWQNPQRICTHKQFNALGCHWICSWASPNKWVLIGNQRHDMFKTKDQYWAYCPTGGFTHHPPFCLSLSPARLLHFYVCPIILL